MSRPLTANPQRIGEAAKFHSAVFKQFGHKCWRCGGKATDAAHIVPRARLGPHRYAAATANGRPLCRVHHNEQEAGLWDWPEWMKNKAIAALNKQLKVKLGGTE